MSRQSIPVHNYAEAVEYLAAGRAKSERPLPGKATRLIRRTSNTIAVRYQWTDIVTYHADGSIFLDTGGWNSKTTREKMNQYMPKVPGERYQQQITISSLEGQLVVALRGPTMSVSVVMHRTANFKPGSGITSDAMDVKVQAELKRLRKLTKDYTIPYVELFIKGDELRECGVCNKAEPTVNQSWQSQQHQAGKDEAEVRMDPAHLIEHMEQKQYPDALLQHAVNCFGTSWHHNLFNKGVTQGLVSDYDKKLARRDFPKLLRRFLRRELGLEFSK